MGRAAILVVAATVLVAGHTQAMAFADRFGQSDQVGGMFIMRIPFGDPAAKSVEPEFGVQLGFQNQQEKLYRADRYDATSGARVPEFDTEVIPTWRIKADPEQSGEQQSQERR